MVSEPIYKGATRPAMLLGVPLIPFIVLFGTAMLLVLWGGLLVSWWIAVVVVGAVGPAIGWMRYVTRRDDQRLRQMFVLARLLVHDRNRRHWAGRSYSPTIYR
ncbi:type VI secretion protein, partial [Rubrivivax gelatinosus]|nr:type VI secretion protein [Rubrivivax gelatinosus]